MKCCYPIFVRRISQRECTGSNIPYTTWGKNPCPICARQMLGSSLRVRCDGAHVASQSNVMLSVPSRLYFGVHGHLIGRAPSLDRSDWFSKCSAGKTRSHFLRAYRVFLNTFGTLCFQRPARRNVGSSGRKRWLALDAAVPRRSATDPARRRRRLRPSCSPSGGRALVAPRPDRRRFHGRRRNGVNRNSRFRGR